MATWHASGRPAAIELADPAPRWLGLEIRHHRVFDANHAVVEFVARCKLGGRAQRLHDTSRFVRAAGARYDLGAEAA